ncbi:hypothetical protein LCGC14_1862820 [marine sediment metagenome]|uniref:Uncharacterized protein n=1 Tax=marine sediment metagenome TaxID=412755 RepID=A0A0F9G7D6_9ZZZZ
MNHSEKLQKCLDAKDAVEIIAEEKVTGKLSEVGDDYVAIVHAVEREIIETVTITEGERKGETEEQKHTIVIELETIILLKDIHAVSRIMKKKFK